MPLELRIHDQTGGYHLPVFFGKPGAVAQDGNAKQGRFVALQQIVEQTVTGLGYDLVEVQRQPGGVLRVTIDIPWRPPIEGQSLQEVAFVTVEDCETVTRQLQFALEVDGIDYQRLEVSSPGIDRLLRHERDFIRFVGEEVDITLKEPIGVAVAQGQVAANRKKFRGTLERTDVGGWQIVWSDAPPVKPGQRVSKKRVPATLHALGFTLDELREARLAPVVNFKGRPLRGVVPQSVADADTGDVSAGE